MKDDPNGDVVIWFKKDEINYEVMETKVKGYSLLLSVKLGNIVNETMKHKHIKIYIFF